MLGDELDKSVQLYVKVLREAGAVINTSITMATAEGDSNLLQCNGCHIICGKHYLQRMGYVKRRASTTAKVSVSDFENAKLSYLYC